MIVVLGRAGNKSANETGIDFVVKWSD